VTKTIKVALAGAGAFGIAHLELIQTIDRDHIVLAAQRPWERGAEAHGAHRRP